jgi:hypothetical protein
LSKDSLEVKAVLFDEAGGGGLLVAETPSLWD